MDSNDLLDVVGKQRPSCRSQQLTAHSARARRRRAAIHLTRKETAMRKVIINEQLSLDGVMQGPGGPERNEGTHAQQG